MLIAPRLEGTVSPRAFQTLCTRPFPITGLSELYMTLKLFPTRLEQEHLPGGLEKQELRSVRVQPFVNLRCVL